MQENRTIRIFKLRVIWIPVNGGKKSRIKQNPGLEMIQAGIFSQDRKKRWKKGCGNATGQAASIDETDNSQRQEAQQDRKQCGKGFMVQTFRRFFRIDIGGDNKF